MCSVSRRAIAPNCHRCIPLTHDSFASACFKAVFSYHGFPEPKLVTPDTDTCGETLYPPVLYLAPMCEPVTTITSGVPAVVRFVSENPKSPIRFGVNVCVSLTVVPQLVFEKLS